MPTLVRTVVPIGGGEHLIRFVNLSGDEILLEPVTIAYAEALTEIATLDALVGANRPILGSRFAESVTVPDVILSGTQIVTDLIGRWGIGIWHVSLWGPGFEDAATVATTESARGWLVLGTSESDTVNLDDTVDWTVTNVEGREILESLDLSVETVLGAVLRGNTLNEELPGGDVDFHTRIVRRKRTKRAIYRWGW